MSDKKKFKDTKVGGWLTNNAPDILETVSDLTPDGGVLDAVAGLIRGKEDMPAELKMEFERMYIEERLALEEGVPRVFIQGAGVMSRAPVGQRRSEKNAQIPPNLL